MPRVPDRTPGASGRGSGLTLGGAICFYAFMRTTVEFPVELFRKAKACAASRGESLKTLITRAVAAEIDEERSASPARRVTLPLFGDPNDRRVNVRAADLARALADDDVVRAGRRRPR